MQCGQPDGGLDSFGKLEHLLLLPIDRCVLVWPKVASLSDRTEVRIAQAHANPSKLAILAEVSGLVCEYSAPTCKDLLISLSISLRL